jgi:hypothetical protein
MRTALLVAICLVCTTGVVMAQHQEQIPVPQEIGNRQMSSVTSRPPAKSFPERHLQARDLPRHSLTRLIRRRKVLTAVCDVMRG